MIGMRDPVVRNERPDDHGGRAPRARERPQDRIRGGLGARLDIRPGLRPPGHTANPERLTNPLATSGEPETEVIDAPPEPIAGARVAAMVRACWRPLSSPRSHWGPWWRQSRRRGSPARSRPVWFRRRRRPSSAAILVRLVAGTMAVDPRLPGLVPGYQPGELAAFAVLTTPLDAAHRAALTATGARILRSYRTVDMVAIAARPSTIRAVAGLSWVAWLAPVDVIVALGAQAAPIPAASVGDAAPLPDQTRTTAGDLGAPALWTAGSPVPARPSRSSTPVSMPATRTSTTSTSGLVAPARSGQGRRVAQLHRRGLLAARDRRSQRPRDARRGDRGRYRRGRTDRPMTTAPSSGSHQEPGWRSARSSQTPAPVSTATSSRRWSGLPCPPIRAAARSGPRWST